MLLPGAIEASVPSVPGFDSDTIVTAAVAQRFFSGGYKFCLRYLSRGPESPRDLSTQEATDILNSGLALMPVQHVRNVATGWSPTASLGQQDGQDAATNAQDIGFPPGVNVWCDLENVVKTAASQDIIDYCQAWYSAVDSAGYIPGLYVGFGTQLSGQQLHDLSFQHYWKSASSVPEIAPRGYQLFQLFPSLTANGIGIDVDVTQTDGEGGVPQWLRMAT
jgi:hypothetical protein